MAVAERARLRGAAGGVVLGVEVQHDHPFAQSVLQPDRLAGLRRQGEVGSLVADLNAACHARPASLCPPGITNSQRKFIDILLVLKDRDSRAAHAACRVVPAAPLAGVLRGRTPRGPGACAGTANKASPR